MEWQLYDQQKSVVFQSSGSLIKKNEKDRLKKLGIVLFFIP